MLHEPVLLTEVLEFSGPARRVVDGTVGDGGHAAAFAGRGAAVLGVDRDSGAIARARLRLAGADARLVTGSFDAPEFLEQVRAFRPDLVLLDLGVSSRQLDDPELGFTFRPNAPLDMRMSGEGATGADYLNSTPEAELARTFRELADEPKARRLGAEIARRRSREPFTASDHLVRAIRAVLGPRSGPADFARIFQAVRIAVNHELERVERGLVGLRDALAPGGRLAVICYHSGEDRIVKQAFRDWARACVCPPAVPVCICRGRPLGTLMTRRPVRPSAREIATNPRARSARLRVFQVSP
jgi:16S rRNA (cytosine1402-N4)-methyltransferase